MTWPWTFLLAAGALLVGLSWGIGLASLAVVVRFRQVATELITGLDAWQQTIQSILAQPTKPIVVQVGEERREFSSLQEAVTFFHAKR